MVGLADFLQQRLQFLPSTRADESTAGQAGVVRTFDSRVAGATLPMPAFLRPTRESDRLEDLLDSRIEGMQHRTPYLAKDWRRELHLS